MIIEGMKTMFEELSLKPLIVCCFAGIHHSDCLLSKEEDIMDSSSIFYNSICGLHGLPCQCVGVFSISERSSAIKQNFVEMYNVQRGEETENVIAKFFMAYRIAFNATHSPFYKEMVRIIIAVRSGFIQPSYNKVRTTTFEE
jgi:hypothetical protein